MASGLGLLAGETQGFAIDATVAGGSIGIKDTGTPSNNRNDVTFNDVNIVQAGTSGKVVNWSDGTLHTIAAGQVAQEYDGAQFGILIEPAATNLHPQSSDLSLWANVQATLAANQTTAPNGVAASAGSITADAGSLQHIGYWNPPLAVSAATNYTFSVFLKDSTARYGQVYFNSDTANNSVSIVVDLQTGAITDTDVGSGGTLVSSFVRFIGNGWYRAGITGSFATGTTLYPAVGVVNAASITPDGDGNFLWTAAGTEKIFVWGAQVELGGVATSYIATAGATATRAVDNVSALVTTFPYSATAGTIYVDAKRRYAAASSPNTFPKYWALDNGTTNESLFTQLDKAGAQEEASAIDGGVEQGPIVAGSAVAANTRLQLSYAWAANDLDASLDGAASVTDATATMPTVTKLIIGDWGTLDKTLSGYIYRLVYVPRQVETDANNLETWRYNFVSVAPNTNVVRGLCLPGFRYV